MPFASREPQRGPTKIDIRREPVAAEGPSSAAAGAARAVLTRVADGEQFELTKDATAGRLGSSEVKLTDGSASRTHARFAFRDGGIWLEDLKSAYGTFVNEARVEQPVRIASGDRLKFGIEEFLVVLPAPDEAVPPAPKRPPSEPRPAVPSTARTFSAEGEARKRPGAWADSWDPKAPQKSTRYIPPEEMKKMMAGPATGPAPPPDIQVPHVQIVTGDRAGTLVALAPGEKGATKEWSIGSHAEREVQVPDHGVSALHARIVNDGKRWKVVDQMSANGTFVNGKRSNVSYLSSGDRLRFGPVDCVFWLPTGAAAGAGAGRLRWLVGAVALVGVLAAAFLAWRFLHHR